ncbi:hypothetical protein [Olivibacter sp. XZL3]|uniref:hypothetical protein n=1 Tax=Olivibacter sp. XZL3 TaxID=1735116 RepID=UPI001066FF7D|nr:hypothetical protein [Olivibacter sp. XZL3]
MKIFLQPHIQELKKKVLEIAQINNIIPADCYRLAMDISTKTHKTISQTTIKRIYGFAQSPYAPSTFTLNALSQYCGYDGWTDFIEQMEALPGEAGELITWNEISQAAHNITQFTMQTNKHKCGIPYTLTIERQSITQHIQRFLDSNAAGCIISAPTGTGKTIGITQWLDRQLLANHIEQNNNIFLHVNSPSLFFAAEFGFHSNKWLAHLLNFPQQRYFEDFILKYEKSAPGNFYIIIDDFNDNLINDRLFDIVFRQLIDMTVYLSNYPWMKIIITLRPSTWQKHGHLIENHTAINRLWFTNFSCSKRTNAVNLHPFTSEELYALIGKIGNSPSTVRDYVHKYFPVVSLPLHFQYYYQLKSNDRGLETLDPADEFAIASLYLHKKVLKGALAADKQFMLSRLIEITTFSDEHAFVNKKEAYAIIKENNSIYNQLLHAGVLYEYQEKKGIRTVYQIKFRSPLIAAYFIAQHALEKRNGQIDKGLLAWLKTSPYSKSLKLMLLKWLIIYALEFGDLVIFNHFKNIDFIERHLASLVLFTCSNLDYPIRANAAISSTLNPTLAKSALIDIALDHLLVEAEYELALNKLLRYSVSPQQKILLHTSLAFFAFLSLRDEEIQKHREALLAIPQEHFADFTLNPLLVVENMHHYCQHKALKEEAIEEIRLFCDYPQRKRHRAHKQLIYMLGYILLKIKPSDDAITSKYLQLVNQYGPNLKRKITKDFKACIPLKLVEST